MRPSITSRIPARPRAGEAASISLAAPCGRSAEAAGAGANLLRRGRRVSGIRSRTSQLVGNLRLDHRLPTTARHCGARIRSGLFSNPSAEIMMTLDRA